MNRDETTALLRTRRELTGSTYNDDTIADWTDVLEDRTYDECRRALIRAASTEKRITVAHVIERLTPHSDANHRREPPICIRCRLLPAEPLRTRCAFCQTAVDDEVARGVMSPAMLGAIAAARRPRRANTEVVE
jgi:hypothetical protein